MISTRNVLNQQAQAIGGQARRYEQPVSSFTRQAMPTVAAMSRPQQTTPTQSMPTRQPVEAPSTLSAIASGVMGGGPSGFAPLDAGYAPANDFEAVVDEATFGGVPSGLAKDRAVSGVVNATLASLLGAPTGAAMEVGMKSAVPGPMGLMSLVSDLVTRTIANNQLKDAYGPHMGGYTAEGFETAQETAPFSKAGDEMAIGGMVSTPGSTSVQDNAMYGLRGAMMDDAQDRTRNIALQSLAELGEVTGISKPTRTIYDSVVLPPELLRRMQMGSSAPQGGVVDRGLEQDFASMLNDDMVKSYAESGIDVRTELPYSPVDPETMEPLGKAIPSNSYQDLLSQFDKTFGSIFGGGGGGEGGVGSAGGGRASSDAGMSGETDAGGLGGFGMW